MRYKQMMKCDNCKHYSWYYDYCDKWKCIVDTREVHDCFEKKRDDKDDKDQ